MQLIGEDLTPTGTWLFPYEVTVVSGDGLKARHLVPGETYTRPGLQPTNLVTCDFTGATKEVGSFEVQITGAHSRTVIPCLVLGVPCCRGLPVGGDLQP